MSKKPAKTAPEPAGGATPEEAAEKAHGGWARDNLEAVVVAVIMALVIRHFCVEAFKIPTGSMEPTLFGNRPADGINGDRILVNKFVYRFSEPKRWDVIVFKYPLDRTKNYIKRLVGLPGEEIKIRGGNVYVNREPPGSPPKWEIARKPRDVQEAVWQEIYPAPRWDPPGTWVAGEGTEFRPDGAGGTVRGPSGGEAWIHYRGDVRAYRSSHQREAQPPLSEVKLSLRARPDAGELRVRLHLDLFPKDPGDVKVDAEDCVLLFRVPVGAAGKTTAAVNGKEAASADFALEAGRETALEFVHADARLSVRAGGRERLSCDIPPPPHSYEMILRLSVGLAGGRELAVRDLEVFRDLFYQEDLRGNGLFGEARPVRVPPDCFVGMGDNSSSSKDSRLWKKVEIALKDGRTVTGEYDPEVFVRHEDSGEIEMTDVHGNRRRLSRDQVEDFFVRPESAPFVPRECLIGQAFMVFWPLKRVHIIK
ncbi:MAG: signal peptidase I [Planctomycetes bacterium]|jgi:signal peptidase I|nr:signal peptidase I [Planctomycetota bacterium]